MAKYKVIRGGYRYGSNDLLINQIFEGSDKGEKFLDEAAITIKYMGQEVAVPKSYVEKVDDSTPLTDTKKMEAYNANKKMIKSATRLAGLGAGLYLANKTGKGTWSYIGYGLVGLILGGIVGGQFSNIVLKK